MRKILLVVTGCLMFFSTVQLNAQKKNVIKVNFLSLAVKTYNFQYERVLSDKSSFQLGCYYTGAKAGDVSLTGFGITPEYRMYLSSAKTAPQGFFVAPFVRYSNYTLKADVLDNNGNTAEGKASFTAIRPGLLVGYQWLFSEKVSFEWFLGPAYSINSVKVKSTYGEESDFSANALNGFGIRFGLSLGLAL